jgi:hypothetical protein
VASRTFSFRAEPDFAERHERALRELDRLREEQPRLADSIRYDFDVRLLEAQRRNMQTPAQRLHATIAALVDAVEGALPDERLIESAPPTIDEETAAIAQTAAEAVARRYESDTAG